MRPTLPVVLPFLLLALGPVPSSHGAEQPEQVWCSVCEDFVDATGGDHAFSNPRDGRCPRQPDARLAWNPDGEDWREASPDASVADAEPAPPAEASDGESAETAPGGDGEATGGSGGNGTTTGGSGPGGTKRPSAWREKAREAMLAVPAWGWLVAAGTVAAFLLAPLFRGRHRKAAPRFDVVLQPGALVCSSEDIGDGGTAVVHEALYKKRRSAVVKRMRNRGGGFGEKNFAILEYEASVLGRLAPTHVVPELLVSPTRTELGVPPRVDVWEYYAMSVASGRPWPESGGPGGRDETRRALAALCEALVRLHELGIGHHDLKPRNIFWDGRRVTLLDFGSAVDHRDGAPDRLRPNPLADKQAGSKPWVPPVSDGKVLADLSPASDAWVFGLIFCESLSPGCISDGRARLSPERPADRERLRSMVASEAGSSTLADLVVDGLFALDKGRRTPLEKFLGYMRDEWRV